MSKHWKPGKKAVELKSSARPSRIRRDPVPLVESKVEPPSTEREVWSTVAGVVLFGLACAALTVGISDITNQRSSDADAGGNAAQFAYCYSHRSPNCVLDGDTVYVSGQRMEIAGIDAPEIRGAQCGQEESRGVDAAVQLLALLNSGKVTVSGPLRDQNGRSVRKLQVNERDVGGAMINAGVAREYGGGPWSWCS